MKRTPPGVLRAVVAASLFWGCATSRPSPQTGPIEEAAGGKTPPVYDREAMGLLLDAKQAELQGERLLAASYLMKAVALDSTSGGLYGALARNLHALGRYGEVLEPARRAVRLDPENGELRWILYQALIEAEADTAAAIVQLEALSRVAPNPLPVYDNLLKLYAARGQRPDYLKTLDRVVALPFLDAGGHLKAAQAYASQGVPKKAIAEYRRALPELPTQIAPWNSLAQLLLAEGDTLEALQSLQSGVRSGDYRVDPSTGPLWGLLARLYESDALMDGLLSSPRPDTVFVQHLAEAYAGIAVQAMSENKIDEGTRHFERAANLYTQLHTWRPSDPQPLGQLGEILLHMNRPQDARQALSMAVKLQAHPMYVLGLAQSHRLEGDWATVIQILRTLPRRVPSDSFVFPRVITELGNAYRATGQLAEARNLYQFAADANPSQLMFRFELARSFALEENWTEAATQLQDLLSAAESDPSLLKQVLFELARSLERLDRFDESVDTFSRLLVYDPLDHRSLNYVGYMFAERGVRLKEAEQYVARALEAMPQSGPYLDSMGWIYYQQKRYPEAMEYLKQAVEVEEAALEQFEPGDPGRPGQEENLRIILDHAGDAARALGKPERARHHWERALEFDPGNEVIRRKLDELSQPNKNAGPGEIRTGSE